MADEKLMIDSSILIDYFRKTDKSKSKLVSHFKSYKQLYISSITEFEVLNGATEAQREFWEGMLVGLIVLNLDSLAARKATEIVAQLKTRRKGIDKPDLFIAATAVVHGLKLDTLNVKHFVHIEGLELLQNDGK